MKKIKISVFMLVVALATVSCNNATEAPKEEANHEMHDDASEMKHDAVEAEMQMMETSIDAALAKSITVAYLVLKDALVNDNAEGAKTAAASIEGALEGTEDELGKKLLVDAEHIAATVEIEHQREHLETLTKNVVTLNTQVDTGEELYLQHCPMAFDGRGADWISSSEEIMNPYFGDRMMKCGRVERKL